MDRRTLFWKNVVKLVNFRDDEERWRIIQLTHGPKWTAPEEFTRMHQYIYQQVFYSIIPCMCIVKLLR